MRVFRYDKKKNTLVIQSLIMIAIAGVMFFQYSYTHNILFLVLMAVAIAFVGIYFYRIFLMRIIFDNNSVTFKGLNKQYRIEKEDIFDINILIYKGKETYVKEYNLRDDLSHLKSKAYVLIRANDKPINQYLSMFNAATSDYISLEYTSGLEAYLDKLLIKDTL